MVGRRCIEDGLRVLLETNLVIRLSISGVQGFTRRKRLLLEDENTDRIVSSISLLEIAMKVNTGKLAMSEATMNEALSDLAATVLPYSEKHAKRLFGLPYHHRDPFGRMLICVALQEGLPVMTTDESFRLYAGVKVI